MKIPLAHFAVILLLSYGMKTYAANGYKGTPWGNVFQQVPGKIQCELYDTGGEGVSFHDTDRINEGSGGLNPADGTFLNEFRIKEAVDISYTKSNDIDRNPFNMVEPMMDQLYVGWTKPGEWMNYSIGVKTAGTYTIDLMYTACGDGVISFDLNGKALTGKLKVLSTKSDKEPLAWRQWHHWNRMVSLATVRLKKGIQVLTLRVVSNGNMNFDFLDFKLNKSK